MGKIIIRKGLNYFLQTFSSPKLVVILKKLLFESKLDLCLSWNMIVQKYIFDSRFPKKHPFKVLLFSKSLLESSTVEKFIKI